MVSAGLIKHYIPRPNNLVSQSNPDMSIINSKQVQFSLSTTSQAKENYPNGVPEVQKKDVVCSNNSTTSNPKSSTPIFKAIPLLDTKPPKNQEKQSVGIKQSGSSSSVLQKRKYVRRKPRKKKEKFPKWSTEVGSLQDFNQFVQSQDISVEELLSLSPQKGEAYISPTKKNIVPNSPSTPVKQVKTASIPSSVGSTSQECVTPPQDDVESKLFTLLPKPTKKLFDSPAKAVHDEEEVHPMTPEKFFEKLRLSPSPIKPSTRGTTASFNIIRFNGNKKLSLYTPVYRKSHKRTISDVNETKAARSLFSLWKQGNESGKKRKNSDNQDATIEDVFRTWADSADSLQQRRWSKHHR